jgi:hypothetical protein
MEKGNNNRIQFLYASINDAQELIRFIDTKTALSISIIGALIFGIFASLDNLVKYYNLYSFSYHLELILLIILIILCIWVIARIIRPTYNPYKNLIIDSEKEFKVMFYLSENKYHIIFPFFNSKKHKLIHDFDKYINSIKISSDEDLIEALCLELFKVSYTRNIKNDRFNFLIILLIVSTIVFIIQYLTYLSQTDSIKITLENLCCK